jgi:hypothetical protein
MPRQVRNKGGNANQSGKRAAPYEGRPNRKGNNQQNAANGGAKGANQSDHKAGGKRGGGRGGRGGRGGGRGGRGDSKPKPTTAEDLDREMDRYWGKSEEHAQKKLDTDMDDYWKTKDAAKDASEEEVTTTAVEAEAEAPAAEDKVE